MPVCHLSAYSPALPKLLTGLGIGARGTTFWFVGAAPAFPAKAQTAAKISLERIVI